MEEGWEGEGEGKEDGRGREGRWEEEKDGRAREGGCERKGTKGEVEEVGNV